MYYSIDDQHGTNICGGLEVYHKALAHAQQLANEQGAPVRIYGSEPVCEGDEGETVWPDQHHEPCGLHLGGIEGECRACGYGQGSAEG